MDKKKILLVDDNPITVKIFSKRFEVSDYEVITAEDGEAALEQVKVGNPDLVVLDLMLPKINGYKVCALLKSDIRYAHIPIILFSAKGSEEDVAMGKEVGCDAYIMKLDPVEKLLATIKELLDKPKNDQV